MNSDNRITLLTLLPVLLLLCPTMTLADATLSVPLTVEAGGDGAFTFIATLVAGEGVVGWGGAHWEGTVNVEANMWIDTFCIDPQPIAPGDGVSFEVFGSLINIEQGGQLVVDSFFCEGGSDLQTVFIIAPSVGTTLTTWSGLKASYR